jgi:hypothetical protein
MSEIRNNLVLAVRLSFRRKSNEVVRWSPPQHTEAKQFRSFQKSKIRRSQ